MRSRGVAWWLVGGTVLLVALCLSGNLRDVDLDAGMLTYGALGLLVIGGLWGAAYARARRSYADYRGAQRIVKVARRGVVLSFGVLLRRAALVAVVLWLAWLAWLGARSSGA